MKKYNKTQLSVYETIEKGITHRDFWAHAFRFLHVLKRAKINNKVIDIGCGTGALLETFWRNKYKCDKYLGLDIRKKTIENANKNYSKIPWAEFKCNDLCLDDLSIYGNDWDMICSFEVMEHIGKQNADKFLKNIYNLANENTEILISTPNYDEKVGAAQNHIINGEVCEFEHFELQKLLEKYFIIKEKYGTFASQKDYKHLMNDWQTKMFDALNKYYDNNLISVLMAPFFPEQARNCIWILRRKELNKKMGL